MFTTEGYNHENTGSSEALFYGSVTLIHTTTRSSCSSIPFILSARVVNYRFPYSGGSHYLNVAVLIKDSCDLIRSRAIRSVLLSLFAAGLSREQD